MTRLLLKVHKWIGICLGILLFTWLVSGMAMILPMRLLVPPGFNAVADIGTVPLAPATAAAMAPGDSAAPRTVRLVGVGGRPFYQVSVKGQGSALLDATTGALFTVTPQVAESLARLAIGARDARVASVEELREHRLDYSSGPLPAYRIAFDDARGSRAYVSPRDGSVRADSRGWRIRTGLARLHTFEPIEFLSDSKDLRDAALHTTSVIGLCLVFTGYYLALPGRWRRRQDRRQPSED